MTLSASNSLIDVTPARVTSFLKIVINKVIYLYDIIIMYYFPFMDFIIF
jgi:hypothetical protein